MLQRISGKAIVLVMLTAFPLIGNAKPVRHYASCERRIQKAERNLERAIQRHGLHSTQAERRRDQLERVRARCHG